MQKMNQYCITDTIFHSEETLIYQGHRESDELPVIIKTLNRKFPSTLEIVNFTREFEILKNLHIDGVPVPLAKEKDENTYMIVFKSKGHGKTLKTLIRKQAYEIKDFLPIAIQLTRILGDIHQNGIIHKDIKPQNILINENNLQIIDFGISTQLKSEEQELIGIDSLEGTLPYISPEQTGRMNRSIDYRSDFYSLGVTFFEMLTGSLPFEAKSSMEWVHHHIAVKPPLCHEICSRIPDAVSKIIDKLLSKNAEDRYQMAIGIQKDLESCLEKFTKSGKMDGFIPGKFDLTNQFIIPEKLFGRDEEVSLLLESFKRICEGQKEYISVFGYSGIGKTMLIHEVHKPMVERRGYFISGKFDQFTRDTPYLPLIQAFQAFFKQILSESDQQLQQWKEKILSSVGENVQVIIDIIPDLELVIGKQPALQKLNPSEAQNRFILTFQSFLSVITQKEHPLVFFIDDLQWADLATLSLIEVITTDPELNYLLFIGSYRDNEVDESHPTIVTLEKIRKLGTRISQIHLKPLTFDHINALINETLHMSLKDTKFLTQLIIDKTKGNPFFTNEFFKNLYQEKLITFDFNNYCWNWDLSEIKQKEITGNVIELLIQRIKQFPNQTQRLLTLAACIGNQFDLKDLVLIAEQSVYQTTRDLWPALMEGIIIPKSKAYQGLKEIKNVDGKSDVILNLKALNRFQHDKLQQAAYFLIDEDLRIESHLKMGRLLLSNIKKDQKNYDEALKDYLFDIVGHLNEGQSKISNIQEKKLLAELNLKAGKKAKESAAFQGALTYLNTAGQLLDETKWEKYYNLSMEISITTIETAYIASEFELMEHTAEEAFKNVTTLLERIRIMEVLIMARSTQSRREESLDMILSALNLLGINLPENPGMAEIGTAIEEVTPLLKEKTREDLLNLPDMVDQEKIAAIRIMANAFGAAYVARPFLLPVMICKAVQLSIQFGNSLPSSYFYANMGFVKITMGEVDEALELATMAMELIERKKQKGLTCKTSLTLNVFVAHWKVHLRSLLDPIEQGYKIGLDEGDIEFAGYHLLNCHNYNLWVGTPFHELEKNVFSKFNRALKKLDSPIISNIVNAIKQFVANLVTISINPTELKGDYSDVGEILFFSRKVKDFSTISIVQCLKMSICYLLGEHKQAIKYAEEAKLYLDALVCTIWLVQINFYHSLSILAFVSANPLPDEKESYLKRVKENQVVLQTWARDAPMNNQHKYQLIEAELSKIGGDKERAMELYEQAIENAKTNKYLHEEAIANELYAKFWLEQGRNKIAPIYMTESYYLYELWGAKAKLKQLLEEYSHVITLTSGKGIIEFGQMPNNTMSRITSVQSKGTMVSGGARFLDIESVSKASQILSGEVKMDELLKKLMLIVIENAGAERAFLILKNPDSNELKVEAESSLNHTETTVMQSQSLEGHQGLSVGIVNYCVHSKKSIVLNDAVNSGEFTTDPYIKKKQPKSVLCAPFMNHGQLVGIVYMENNLATNAFSADRIQVLQMLSGQAAISIDNSRLYENLEEKVAQRTEELEKSLDNLNRTIEQLAESKKMASLGELVAGVAHEINTPVGIGVTTASFLEDQSREFLKILEQGGLESSEIKKFGNSIAELSNILVRNLFKAADLIKSFKQIAVDQQNERARKFKIKSYSEEIIQSINPLFIGTKHEIKLTCPDDIEFKSYPGAFTQIITNLVSNSLIHAFDGVEKGKIEVDLSLKDEKLLFQYRDNGVGMDRKSVEKIFNPFFTSKKLKGGTGLGMNIVYNLVTQTFHGIIQCTSSPGKGIQFNIELYPED